MNYAKLNKIVNYCAVSSINNQEVRSLINRWYELICETGECKETREIIRKLESLERKSR